jgi:hypothetical protein
MYRGEGGCRIAFVAHKETLQCCRANGAFRNSQRELRGEGHKVLEHSVPKEASTNRHGGAFSGGGWQDGFFGLRHGGAGVNERRDSVDVQPQTVRAFLRKGARG